MATISSVTINNASLNSNPLINTKSNTFTISGTELPTDLTAPTGVTWAFGQGAATTSSITTTTTTCVVGTFTYTPSGPTSKESTVASTLSVTVGTGTTPRYPATGTKPVRVPTT